MASWQWFKLTDMKEMTVQSVAVIPCGELTADKERRGWWGGGGTEHEWREGSKMHGLIGLGLFRGLGLCWYTSSTYSCTQLKMFLYYSTILSVKPIDGTVCSINDTVNWTQASPSDYLIGLTVHRCGEHRCLLFINLLEIRSTPGQGATAVNNSLILP